MKPEGFLQIERIKKKKDFDFLYNAGSFLKGNGSYSCIYKNNNFGFLRIGIIVKKKIGNAVKRNYEKRLIREFFRKYPSKDQLPFDIVIMRKNSSSSFRQKWDDFNEIISRIREREN